MPAAAPPGQLTNGTLLAALTREIVRLHAAHYGKGPMAARSYWAGDTLICQMEEALTHVNAPPVFPASPPGPLPWEAAHDARAPAPIALEAT